MHQIEAIRNKMCNSTASRLVYF